MTTFVVVHEWRPAGALGAAVLCRLLKRRAQAVRSDVARAVTSSTATFWTSGIEELLRRTERTDEVLVLVGITFHDLEEANCLQQLSALREAFADVVVWTHRYPDGYLLAPGISLHIPPDDVIYNDPGDPYFGSLGLDLGPYEKRLLALSLVVVKALPLIGQFGRSASALANALATAPEKTWNDLVSGDYDVDGATADFSLDAKDREQLRVDTTLNPATEVIQFKLTKSHRKLAVPLLDDRFVSENLSDRVVAICAESGDSRRIILYRNDRAHTLPSLRWLIENRFAEKVPLRLRGSHAGPPNVVYFDLPQDVKYSSVRTEIVALAGDMAVATTGGRALTAALTRDVEEVANGILASLDLVGAFTQAQPEQFDGDGLRPVPALRVEPTGIYVLMHRSSRSGGSRATLVVPVESRSPEATAFLYRSDGYNLLKLERALEGALLGLNARQLSWLRPTDEESAQVYLPNRLRVDVRPRISSETDVGEFTDRVHRLLEASPISTVKKEVAGVRAESVIGRVMDRHGMSNVVVLAESETIGPSVAHGLVQQAVARHVSIDSGRQKAEVHVLDVFAGSGVANRMLRFEGVNVFSVDKYVSAESVGLSFRESWLRTDARDVLVADPPVLSGDFDIIALDPPHAELMDLLFGAGENCLVAACSKRADYLVLYQGHSTQSGRMPLLEQGLERAGWKHSHILQVDEELIVIATSTDMPNPSFQKRVNAIIGEVNHLISQYGLEDLVPVVSRYER